MSQVREFASIDKLVIGGSGCEGTGLTIDMSNKMGAAGADAVMVLTPCYFKGNMDVNALVGHYKAVADACSVPVFLYNIPMATGHKFQKRPELTQFLQGRSLLKFDFI